jgi:hypothetical protein
MLRQHCDVRHLKDSAAIADDTTHAHGAGPIFDDDCKECVGKRNARNLFTSGREASPRAERAVLGNGGIAHGDLILWHPSTLSAHFRDARDCHFLVVAV